MAKLAMQNLLELSPRGESKPSMDSIVRAIIQTESSGRPTYRGHRCIDCFHRAVHHRIFGIVFSALGGEPWACRDRTTGWHFAVYVP